MRMVVTSIASAILLASCAGNRDSGAPSDSNPPAIRLFDSAQKNSCAGKGQGDSVEPCDSYLPSIRESDSTGYSTYRFSGDQLEKMRRSHLSRDLFLRFIEREWPTDRLRAFCTPENRWPAGYQNLVPDRLLFGDLKIPVHKDKKLDFDQLYVYVNEDDGNSSYGGTAGTQWKRWTYSLNVTRGADHWVIIESLPNDFVDNPTKYLRDEDAPKLDAINPKRWD